MSEIRIDQDLDPIFARTTAANKRDGTSAASGVVRYENVIDPVVVDTKREWDRGTYTRTKSVYNRLTANQSNIETDLTGIASVGAGVGTRSTDWAWQGSYSLKVQTASTSANYVGLTGLSFEANKQYTASAYCYNPGPNTIVVTLYINLSATSTKAYTIPSGGVVRMFNNPATSAAGAAGTIRFYEATGQTFYVDGIMFEEGSEPSTTWVVGQTDALAISTFPTYSGSGNATVNGVVYGSHAPRIVSGGIVLDYGSANLCQHSELLDNASWGKVGSTISANAVVAPDGATTADKIIEDTSAGNHYAQCASVTASASASYTWSVYLKAAERSIVWLYMSSYSNWTGGDPEVEFDLSAGIATNRGSASNKYGMDPVGNGWYRCWVTLTSIAGSSFGTRGVIALASAVNTTSYTGDGTSGVYAWGAQLEALAFPTGYIPTPSSTTVARSVETLTIPSAGIVNAASGSVIARIYVDDTFRQTANTREAPIFYTGVTTTTNRVLLFVNDTTPAQYTATTNSSGGVSNSAATGAILSKDWHTIGMKWSATEVSLWIDGSRVAIDTSVTPPDAIGDTIYIGGWGISGNRLGTPLDYIYFFNSSISDADMALYTAASGYAIPSRSDKTFEMNFGNNLNFATSGVYVSEWFNMGVSGAVLAASGTVTTPTGTTVLTEYRTANSDTQTDASAWSTTIGTGKYVQYRNTLVSVESTDSLPYVSSTTLYQGSDYGKSATIEESTVNLLTAPTVPATQEVTVTAAGDYSLMIVGTDASSGSVVIEHKREETTTADFTSGTHVGTTASSNQVQLDTATADPTFTRATTALKRDLSSVASGAARYEDIIRQFTMTTQGDWDACTKQGPIQTDPAGNVRLGVIEDGFDTDTSWAWTSGGSTPGTWVWNTASSRIEAGAGGVNAILSYNNFSAKNVRAETTMSRASDGGIVLRYQDSDNFYLLDVDDDTVSATNNLRIYKRVAGVFTALGAAAIDVSFTRDTTHTIAFEVVDSILAAYFDGVLVATVSDTSIATAGKVGMRATGSTNYFHSFKIDTATPLFGRFSAANNPQSGASVATNVPRYTKGKNLLTKNQSDVETNTTGFSINGGGSVTLTRDTTEFWQGTASLKVVTDGTSGSQGFYCNNTLASNHYPGVVPAGSNLVGSLYIKGAGTINVRLQVVFTDGTSQVVSTTTHTTTSSWARYSTAGTATAGKTIRDAWLVIYNSSLQAITYYADGLQIEVGTTPTTWVPGGDNAIMIEESTTNIVQAGGDTFTNGSGGWATEDGSVLTRTTGRTDPFNGTSAYRLELTAGGATQACKYRATAGITSGSGTKYSNQIWVKNNSATPMNVVFLPSSASVTVNQSDGWKLVKTENMTGDGVTGVHIRFHANTNADAIDIDVMWPQMEAKAYCTSYYTPGSTRSSEQVSLSTYPSSGATEGTIIVTAYFSGEKILSTCSRNYQLVDFYKTTTANRIRLMRAVATDRLLARVIGNGGTSNDASWTSPTLTEGWHKVAIRWNSTNVSLWYDGAQRASGSITDPITTTPNASLCIGHIDGSTQWNEPIDDFAFYPVALSDAEMITLTTNS